MSSRFEHEAIVKRGSRKRDQQKCRCCEKKEGTTGVFFHYWPRSGPFVLWLMKRQPEKKALLTLLYESVYERASLAAIRAAAKRKSTGCALSLIVSPFTNKLSRVNPETREIIYTPCLLPLFFPFLSAWLFLSFFLFSKIITATPWNFVFVSSPRSPKIYPRSLFVIF